MHSVRAITNSAYLWTYALIQIPIGAMLDKIGVKWMTRIGTILWSLATFMTAIVSGYGLIILSRLKRRYVPGSARTTYGPPTNILH